MIFLKDTDLKNEAKKNFNHSLSKSIHDQAQEIAHTLCDGNESQAVSLSIRNFHTLVKLDLWSALWHSFDKLPQGEDAIIDHIIVSIVGKKGIAFIEKKLRDIDAKDS